MCCYRENYEKKVDSISCQLESLQSKSPVLDCVMTKIYTKVQNRVNNVKVLPCIKNHTLVDI